MQIEVIDGVAIAARGDVLLAVYRDAARAQPLRALYARGRRLIETHPDGVTVLQIVLGSSRPPDAEAREVNRRELTKVQPSLRRLVTVPLGDEVWLFVVRTTLRAMVAISGAGGQHRVESTIARGLLRIREVARPATPAEADLCIALGAMFKCLDVPLPTELASSIR